MWQLKILDCLIPNEVDIIFRDRGISKSITKININQSFLREFLLCLLHTLRQRSSSIPFYLKFALKDSDKRNILLHLQDISSCCPPMNFLILLSRAVNQHDIEPAHGEMYIAFQEQKRCTIMIINMVKLFCHRLRHQHSQLIDSKAGGNWRGNDENGEIMKYPQYRWPTAAHASRLISSQL